MAPYDLFPVMADIAVSFCVICHVFHPADVSFILPGLCFFVIVGLDIRYLPVPLDEKIILLALVPGIRNDIPVPEGKMSFHVF